MSVFEPMKCAYARALIDPSAVGPDKGSSEGVIPGIPDSHYAPTRRLRLKASVNVPFDSNGHARLYFSPEVNNLLSAVDTSTSTKFRSPQYVKCSGSDGDSMMHYHADGKMYLTERGDQMSHTTKSSFGSTSGCGIGVMHMTSGDGVRATMVSAAAIGNVTDTSSLYTGKANPMGMAVAAGDVVKINASTGDATASNLVPYIITVTGGVYVKTPGTAVTGPLYSEQDLTVTVPASSTYLVEWGMQGASAKATLTAIACKVETTQGTTVQRLVDFTDDLVAFYEDGVLRYRPVAVLYHGKYYGGDLYDGTIIGAPSYAGENLETDIKYNSGNLVKRVHSYKGPISEHFMVHYLPLGPGSFQYRSIPENPSDSGLPETNYSDCCSVVEIDIANSAARSVLVNVDLIVEILTTDRLHTPTTVFSDRVALDMALNAAHRLPIIHANDFHAEFFRRALSKFSIPVSSGLGAILAPLNPAASAGVIAGGAALQRFAQSKTAKGIVTAIDGKGRAKGNKKGGKSAPKRK